MEANRSTKRKLRQSECVYNIVEEQFTSPKGEVSPPSWAPSWRNDPTYTQFRLRKKKKIVQILWEISVINSVFS